MSPETPTSGAPRALAWIAIGLGALAPLAGSPYRAAHGSLDVRELASAVQREEDHVAATELGRWIKSRKPGLRVLDVRTRAEFDAYHIPSAESVPLESLVTTSFPPGATLVLYSEGGAHAAQAWVFLRALGYQRVYFLRGGLTEWLDDVMNPTLAADASPKAKAEFEQAAEISRYFGGVPRADGAATRGGASPEKLPASEAAAHVRRRGC